MKHSPLILALLAAAALQTPMPARQPENPARHKKPTKRKRK